ncbi:hypothetical protein [Aneurinibacillus migulanus]|uniref:Uncharacterized protein n=1 Tax=Aneurinibacillus migulanus TaxID=47500 RepID=A0A0D1YLN4_ANEMI|nr:hypothetical protein [Aneurinibacillus migulanus]KIV59597.1 hypothetical protein TS65_02655 [Aneurinibacillus migulanus]KON93124.1 hypothetical protein AF333_26000 [Aneurinibacillus migulanus]MED0890982.1 hypothetical protein [Aneurinibacillus migulanus]MED1614623.1 hypothetical protein [Aneurinibacillus migulanus]SDK31199.1 hypothetical protein SAMN04487909_14837 [Aneurinibacillus migulanus]
MAYNKQTWKDEIPDLTKPIKDASGKQKMDPQTGRPLYELVQEGTRITSARLNHAEQGIEDAHILIEQLAKEWGGSFVASPSGTAGFQFIAAGLTASWTAGVGYVAGRRFEVAAGSLTLNPTQGQYIYLDTDGVVKRTTSQATANAGLLLWYFATDASKVITSTDRRRTITPDTFAKKEEVVLKEPGKGLSTNDYNNTKKAKVQEHGERLQEHDQRLTVIEDEMGEAAPIPATLKPGIQTITADRTTPFNISSIKGRTLADLLGRDGNCEDASKWDSWQGTLALDTNNKVFGNNGIKISSALSNGYFSLFKDKSKVQIRAGRYYIGLAEVKNGTAPSAIYVNFAGIGGISGATQSILKKSADTSQFNTVYTKLSATSDNPTNFDVCCAASTAIGQYFYVDAIRLYEITAAEYAALDSMTPEQIAAKYPYVDDVKPVRNPYAIRYGKNLLPPFTEWSIYDSSITVKSPYSIEINKEKSGINSNESFAEIKYWAKVQPNTTYTITFNGTANFWVGDNDSNKNRINTPFVGDKPAGVYVFTTKSNTGYLEVVINQNERSAVGSAPYIANNPMLNIGSTALPFEPQNNDYVFYDVSLHSNVDGTVRDELFYRDGQLSKLEKFREIVLDGNLSYEVQADKTGFKNITIKGLNSPNVGLIYGVKFDGKILKNVTTGGFDIQDNTYSIGDGNIYITISDIDSGWGENYTPSEGEIKAYFNGWKMYDNVTHANPYLGTGTRAWVKLSKMVNGKFVGIGDGVDATNTLPTSLADGGYTPYRLIYQLAQPVEVPVTSEGKITLHEGTNVLEVGTGVVIRESIDNPNQAKYNGYENQINRISGSTKLANRADRIFSVYKNTMEDRVWILDSAQGLGYGHVRAFAIGDYTAGKSLVDPNATYSVTYLVLDRYAFTAPLIDLQGEYQTKLAAVVAEMVEDATNLETRVSVVEMQYARKQPYPVIKANLVNGFTTFYPDINSVTYQKTDNNLVLLTGIVIPVVNSPATTIYKLPVGFRPKSRRVVLTSIQYIDANTARPVTFNIEQDGRVCVGDHWLTGGWVLLSGTFISEQ